MNNGDEREESEDNPAFQRVVRYFLGHAKPKAAGAAKPHEESKIRKPKPKKRLRCPIDSEADT